MINMECLRDRLRKLVGKSSAADLSTNALLSDLAKASDQILAHRINELLGGKNKHFAESQAEKLVEQAIKVAGEKIESAELAKCAAEAELTRYRDEVKSRIDTKILEIELQIQQAASKLTAAESRAIAAEERANKAEAKVRRLEDELQAQITRTRARLVRNAA
jgi:hypothetical protein